MADKTVDEKKLRYMEFLQRETGERHHTNLEDMRQYELLRAGSGDTVEEASRIFASDLPGHVSDDRVRNYKYLFVSAITMACRTAMAAGMEAERAYNSSDLFIRRMDRLETVEEIFALHREMFAFYLKEVQSVEKKMPYPKPVIQCMDYIYEHLHERITVADLTACTNMSGSYLSTLFKKETGRSISDYILEKRIEAAENMLKLSDYSSAEIGATLAFSSQSHFIRVFKKQIGCTPREYRDRYYQK